MNGAVNTRYHWSSGLPKTIRLVMWIASVRQITQPRIPSATSTMLAYGCASWRIPGISPRRRRDKDGEGDRRVFSAIRPLRSIFGARLRSRVPQYGHSVMYGLTSDPQFLQTTKRSGPPVLTQQV